MDKEIVVYIHNGKLLNYRKRWNHAIGCYIDRTRSSMREVCQRESDIDIYDMGYKETILE